MTDIEPLTNLREQIGREYGASGPGPYVTISRQCGCSGFKLGLLLGEALNDQAGPGRTWKVLGREILAKLATETNLEAELVEKLEAEQPNLVLDFFRSFTNDNVPSGLEIRNRITSIIRGMAAGGHVVIVGQGGAGATTGIDNGLNIRLEAPEPWRVNNVAKTQDCDAATALAIIKKREQEREYLDQVYRMRFPREPAFHIVYDESVFPQKAIVKHVVFAMRMKNML